MLELADVLRRHWADFARANAFMLTAAHHAAARAVMACRTPELGGHVQACVECGHHRLLFHSCNHRACPKCGGLDQARWAARQEARLLPVPYFLLTFTIPQELRPAAYCLQREFYEAMFDAVNDTLHEFAMDPKRLGGQPGFIAILHTWTREMIYHPHIHVLMPGVALSADGLRVRTARCDRGAGYLFPVKALSAAFRNRLKRRVLPLLGKLGQFPDPAIWGGKWVTDARGVGTGRAAVRYLARYVTKSALTNRRLLGYTSDGKRIILNCQNSKTGKWNRLQLTPDELIRRWCLHVLPPRLRRLRAFGFLSPRSKQRLNRVAQILATTIAPTTDEDVREIKCPKCSGAMEFEGDIPHRALRVLQDHWRKHAVILPWHFVVDIHKSRPPPELIPTAA